MAPALTEAGQSQNFALTSSNCSSIGVRNSGCVGGEYIDDVVGPRLRRADGSGALSDIPSSYISCKKSLISLDGNGVDGGGVEVAFENLTTLAIASELFKVNKVSNSERVNAFSCLSSQNVRVNGGGALVQLRNKIGMSRNLPGDAAGDADGSEGTSESLPLSHDDLGQNVQDLLEVIQGMEKTEEASVQDPLSSNRKSSANNQAHARDSEGSIFSANSHDGSTEFELPNGPVDGIYPVNELDCNLSGVDMMSMCVVELPGGNSTVGMGSSADALIDAGPLGVGSNPSGLLDGGGLDSQLALDSQLGETGLCVSREALSGEKKCEVLRRQIEVERKIERLLRRLGKLQARRMGRHAAEELRGIVEHAKLSLANITGGSPVKVICSGERMTNSSNVSSTDEGKRPSFLSSYVQNSEVDADGLRIPSVTRYDVARETMVKSGGLVESTKRYFGSGSQRARLEDVVDGAFAVAEIGSATRNEELRRRQRRRRRFAEWGAKEEKSEGSGREKMEEQDALDEKRRRLEEGKRDLKVVVLRGGGWRYGESTKEAEVEDVFGRLGAQLRVVEKGIDSDATASSSGAESADEMVTGYSAASTGTLSIGRRAAWKWARERAWVGSRWTWLQAQISDLEVRIRQHSEIHRQIRASKGPLVFAKLAEHGHQLAQTLVVNGFHHSEVGKNVEGCVLEGDSCCRVRPLRSLLRKRRLLHASDPGNGGKRGQSGCITPPSRAAEVLCSGCHWNALRVPPCVLCSAPRKRQSAPSLSTPRAPPPSSLPVPVRVARIDSSFHPILSFPRDVSCDVHIGAIMRTQCWQQDVVSEKGKSGLANFSNTSANVSRGGGTAAGLARRRRGGSVAGSRRGRRPAIPIKTSEDELDHGPGGDFNAEDKVGGSRRRNYSGFRLSRVSASTLTSKLRNKLAKGRRGRGRVGGNHCDPLQRLKQKRLKAAMALQSVCEEADEQLKMELGPVGSLSAPGTAPSSPYPPASPGSPGSTSPPHQSSASSSSSTSSTSHHQHLAYIPSSSMAPFAIGPVGDRKASMLHDLLSRRKRENSYDIDNIVIPYSVASSTRVEKLPYKEILTPKWRVVEAFPPARKLESRDNGVVQRASHESEDEDVSAEAVTERHERCEQEERKRFLRLLRRPKGANSATGEAKSQGGVGGRGNPRRGRADSRAESSGHNTPDPMSPDHHSACPSPLSAANSPPPTPLPLPSSLEEITPVSPEANDHVASPGKSPLDGGVLLLSPVNLGKLVESQVSETTSLLNAKVYTNSAIEAAFTSPSKNIDGRISATESPASSPLKGQCGMSKFPSFKECRGSWGDGLTANRRRTVSLTHLHPSAGGRERCTTPIETFEEFPQPKPFEPYVFPLSDEHYKSLLAKMPAGHQFPPICPLSTGCQPSSHASSTSSDGPTECLNPPSVSSSKIENSSEQVTGTPRSPCSETTESVVEEDDRGEDELDQGSVEANDDPDWTVHEEMRGRTLKR